MRALKTTQNIKKREESASIGTKTSGTKQTENAERNLMQSGNTRARNAAKADYI